MALKRDNNRRMQHLVRRLLRAKREAVETKQRNGNGVAGFDEGYDKAYFDATHAAIAAEVTGQYLEETK
jgi:hypothetical protein